MNQHPIPKECVCRARSNDLKKMIQKVDLQNLGNRNFGEMVRTLKDMSIRRNGFWVTVELKSWVTVTEE